MREVTVTRFICDKCGMSYVIEEDARECEESHKSLIFGQVVSEKWEMIDKYPSVIEISVDGEKVEYYINRHKRG